MMGGGRKQQTGDECTKGNGNRTNKQRMHPPLPCLRRSGSGIELWARYGGRDVERGWAEGTRGAGE